MAESMRAINRQTYSHRNGEVGILLIHGFTGSPGELRPLGEFLGESGYSVEIPILKGHCTNIEDMSATDEQDWIGSALEAYQSLTKDTRKVVVIGHSMGGLIALYLALRYPVHGVVSNCTPIYLTNPFVRIAPYLSRVMAVQKGKGTRSPHIEEYLGGYRDTPLKAVSGLMRLISTVKTELPQIQIPILVQQAKRDITVRPRSAEYIFNQIGSSKKYLKWYAKSGHILPVDVDREQVFTDILSFIREIERK